MKSIHKIDHPNDIDSTDCERQRVVSLVPSSLIKSFIIEEMCAEIDKQFDAEKEKIKKDIRASGIE